MLSAEDSAEPGKWSPTRAPYQSGILDAISSGATEEVVLMTSAQIGKTLLAKAIIGYYADNDPSPLLFVTYSLGMAETFSKDRLAPMARDVPSLRRKIADPRSRDSGNTILHKRFPGGHLTMVGANAAGGLASRPIRVVLLDEVDRYPPSAGTEGDPVRLAIVRTKNFRNRRIVMMSSPGDEETSRILPAWKKSDQRRFHVACPHCGHTQHLVWANVIWEDGKPETAGYRCDDCATVWTDAERVESLQTGVWIAEHPERRVAGFHINELYSPFRRLAEIVADFLDAKDKVETLKVWINTSLGEPWADRESEKVDPDALEGRRESYTDVPDGALLVTMIADTQDDRIEIEFIGWGRGEESWGLDHVVLRGDPGSDELWRRMDDQLARTFTREDGAVLPVTACGIDSGGHYTKQVYAWALKNKSRVLAIKGDHGPAKPLVRTSKKPMANGVRLYLVGADAGKELLLKSRLKVAKPGPGYCHWPRDGNYPDDYFKQLTAEKCVIAYSHGRPVKRWVLKKGDRNEALDLRVYGLAVIALLRPNFEALAARFERDPPRGAPPAARPRPPQRRVIRSAYMGR